MAASSLADLYSFELHFEDAAETFLEADVGISVYASASADNFVTPRIEIQFIATEATYPADAPITSVPSLALGEFRKYSGAFEARILTDSAAGQTRAAHFGYVGQARASLLRSADNWDATTLPYYGIKQIRQTGTDRATDGDLQVTSVSWEILFAIRSDVFPA
jgi:hypothetical protein